MPAMDWILCVSFAYRRGDWDIGVVSWDTLRPWMGAFHACGACYGLSGGGWLNLISAQFMYL